MKATGHPQYFENATITCSSCGSKYTTGSTMETIHVELCSNCHPFYTGEQRFIDSGSRIEKFQKKVDVGKLYVAKKAEDKKKKEANAPKTLREMLMEVQ